MNHSGDVAEQMIRMSLEGVEIAAKISGAAAKEIAVFLAAALKSKNKKLKLKGKARMASLLKSGKALEIFSVKESDLKQFMQGARQYGIVYCVLRNRKNTPDGLCDIMVKADDAPKIERVVERFQFAKVDRAKIESEITKEKNGKKISMTEIAEQHKTMSVIVVREKQAKQLVKAFRKNGIDYLDLKNNQSAHSGTTTILVPENDRERADRLLQQLGIEKLEPEPKDSEPSAPDKNDTEKLLDDLLGTEEGKAEPEKQSEPETPDAAKTTPVKESPEMAGRSPFLQKGRNPPPSENTSESKSKSARDTSSNASIKPSVKEEIREIQAARAKQDTDKTRQDEPKSTDKPKNRSTTHKQPPRSGRTTSKKPKERS